MARTDGNTDYYNYGEGSVLIGIGVSLAIIATAFVGLRLWATKYQQLELVLSNTLIFISLVRLVLYSYHSSLTDSTICNYVLTALDVLAVTTGGVGKHELLNVVNTNSLPQAKLLFFIAEYIYASAISTTKVSNLTIYLQIFPTSFAKRSCYILAGIIGLWWLSVLIFASFQCRPLQAVWSDSILEGACFNQNKFLLGISIANIFIDVSILALPIISIVKLHMKPLAKAAAIGFFLLGVLVIIASIVRLKMLINLGNGRSNADYHILVFDCWVWTHVEVTMAVVYACLPMMKLIWKKVKENIRSRFSFGKRRSSGNESTEEFFVLPSGQQR